MGRAGLRQPDRRVGEILLVHRVYRAVYGLLGGAMFRSAELSVAGEEGALVCYSEIQGLSRSTSMRLGTHPVLLGCWMAKVGVEEVKNTS